MCSGNEIAGGSIGESRSRFNEAGADVLRKWMAHRMVRAAIKALQ